MNLKTKTLESGLNEMRYHSQSESEAIPWPVQLTTFCSLATILLFAASFGWLLRKRHRKLSPLLIVSADGYETRVIPRAETALREHAVVLGIELKRKKSD